MPRQRINPRLAKKHSLYTVDEIARRFGVHRQTVRNWLKAGLEAIDSKRPLLIRGDVLGAFLHKRREARRVRCPPGTLYCAPCRAARRPVGGKVECVGVSPVAGNLRGVCPSCGRLMHRRVNLSRLTASIGDLTLTNAVEALHLSERPDPSGNCHLIREPDDQAEAQS